MGPEIWAQAASPDSTARRLSFAARARRGTLTQTVTKDRDDFTTKRFQGGSPKREFKELLKIKKMIIHS
jgi:hypothetical protein